MGYFVYVNGVFTDYVGTLDEVANIVFADNFNENDVFNVVEIPDDTFDNID